MLDAVLRKCRPIVRMTVKGVLSVVFVALAVILPQIAHAAGGAVAGSRYLPMYAPALLAGCLLGFRWGLGVGILSPLASFAFTSLAFDSAMPAAAKLPCMILELGAFGGVSGLLAKKIEKHSWVAFPAVLAAQISGKGLYVVYRWIAGGTLSGVWSSVAAGWPGLLIQIVVIPPVVMLLSRLLKRDKGE